MKKQLLLIAALAGTLQIQTRQETKKEKAKQECIEIAQSLNCQTCITGCRNNPVKYMTCRNTCIANNTTRHTLNRCIKQCVQNMAQQ